MFIYEKDGQLRFDFNTNSPKETPDMVIKKEDDKTTIEIGDVILPSESESTESTSTDPTDDTGTDSESTENTNTEPTDNTGAESTDNTDTDPTDPTENTDTEA